MIKKNLPKANSFEIVEKAYNLQAFEKFEVQGALRASSGAYFR